MKRLLIIFAVCALALGAQTKKILVLGNGEAISDWQTVSNKVKLVEVSPDTVMKEIGDADAFIEDCRQRLALPVIGLMCIPPFEEEPAPHFALLREIAQRHGLAALSMGMTADFEIAIAFGATNVRVGTAIFGARG